MKANTNKINIWTIITNALILIGAGHGIGCMLLIEAVLIVNPQPLYFSLSESYNHLLPTSALFSLIGQAILVLSMATDKYVELILKIAGIVFLYVGLFYLGVNFRRDSLSQFGLFFSIPFVTLSIILLIRQFKLRNSED
jgi:hypothetical protein